MQHAVVEITGLGMFVALAGQVARTEIVAESLQFHMPGRGALRLHQIHRVALLLGAAIIKQPNLQLVDRVIHAFGGSQRIGQQPCILVIGRHEDVDLRKRPRRDGLGLAWRQRHRDDEQAQ
ncbi:hypothetical protein D3C71_1857570 [compost metagenome]